MLGLGLSTPKGLRRLCCSSSRRFPFLTFVQPEAWWCVVSLRKVLGTQWSNCSHLELDCCEQIWSLEEVTMWDLFCKALSIKHVLSSRLNVSFQLEKWRCSSEADGKCVVYLDLWSRLKHQTRARPGNYIHTHPLYLLMYSRTQSSWAGQAQLRVFFLSYFW